MTLQIDPEFRDLIPPLTADERGGLVESLLADGCRDPIVVWGETIVDGHNRYEICTSRGIPFTTVEKSFSARDEAMLWILRNQLSRRNVSDITRIELAFKFEQVFAEEARRKSLSNLKRGDAIPDLSTWTTREAEPRGAHTRDRLAKLANVGAGSIHRAKHILSEAPAPVLEATRKNQLPINTAYTVTQMPKEVQQDVAERIEAGEVPLAVVKETRKKLRETGIAQYTPHTKTVEDALEELRNMLNEFLTTANIWVDGNHDYIDQAPEKFRAIYSNYENSIKELGESL
jgi:hypothetical protein